MLIILRIDCREIWYAQITNNGCFLVIAVFIDILNTVRNKYGIEHDSTDAAESNPNDGDINLKRDVKKW